MYGPVQTPFEGGTFRIRLIFPEDFPQAPPKGYFLTKIYHPNISEKGEICVNSLKKDWEPSNWNLKNILDVLGLIQVIKCLLIIPFPESSLNEEAGKQFMENYEEYYKYATMITNTHARQEGKENSTFIINPNFGNQILASKSQKAINDQKKWMKRL